MWPFKKKKQKTTTIKMPEKEPECIHKYQDFPWYIESHTYIHPNSRKIIDYQIKIMEPYVCVKCYQRKDVVLVKHTGENTTYENYWNTIQELEKKYKDKIKSRPEVEDEINDMILVDREYINIYHKIVK